MKKQIFAGLLAALMLLSACGGDAPADTADSGDNPASGDTTTAPPEDEYEYPTLDMKGEKFTILNTTQPYGFYTTLDFEEATGDSVDDAIYMRNLTLEEKFKFDFEIIEDFDLKNAATALETAVLANEDAYDVAFIRDYWITGALTQEMLMNLDDADGYHFDEPWWDGAATEEAKIGTGGATYFAFTDVTLAEFEGAIAIFFNEGMLNDMGADLPYDLVREGKWTLDEFGKYLKLGANLNGDDSFIYSKEGKATYGVVTWNQGAPALVTSCGLDFITKDENNQAVFACEGEKFIDTAEKIINLLSQEGYYVNNNSTDTSGSDFNEGRFLMTIGQLTSAKSKRDKDIEYGIIPMPKLDENQERYRCLRSYSYLMCVPITNSIPDETAKIMDAMSYLSWKDVMPEYYDTLLSVKSLRNDDSVEMLHIIRDSRCIDIGIPYGWSDSLRMVITNSVQGSGSLASKYASYKTSTEGSIEQIMEIFNK